MQKVVPLIEGTGLRPGVLRPAQAAEYLGISRAQLYVLVKSGEIALLKLGERAAAVKLSCLDAYIDSRPRTAA